MKELWPIHLVALVLTALLLGYTSAADGGWPILVWLVATPIFYGLVWLLVLCGSCLLLLPLTLIDEIRGDNDCIAEYRSSFP